MQVFGEIWSFRKNVAVGLLGIWDQTREFGAKIGNLVPNREFEGKWAWNRAFNENK